MVVLPLLYLRLGVSGILKLVIASSWQIITENIWVFATMCGPVVGGLKNHSQRCWRVNLMDPRTPPRWSQFVPKKELLQYKIYKMSFGKAWKSVTYSMYQSFHRSHRSSGGYPDVPHRHQAVGRFIARHSCLATMTEAPTCPLMGQVLGNQRYTFWVQENNWVFSIVGNTLQWETRFGPKIIHPYSGYV